MLYYPSVSVVVEIVVPLIAAFAKGKVALLVSLSDKTPETVPLLCANVIQLINSPINNNLIFIFLVYLFCKGTHKM